MLLRPFIVSPFLVESGAPSHCYGLQHKEA